MIRRAHDYFSKRGVPLVSNQINFSLVRFKSSMETLKVCNELGIKVLAYFPLGNGKRMLNGKAFCMLSFALAPPKKKKTPTMKAFLQESMT
jgi:diketogulonate reductase-like aldo/keto reductase